MNERRARRGEFTVRASDPATGYASSQIKTSRSGVTHIDYVFGQHAVSVVLERRSQHISEIWLQRGRDNRLVRRLTDFAKRRVLPVHSLARSELDRLWPDCRHQGVVVRLEVTPDAESTHGVSLESLLANCDPCGIVLALDGVQDPRNLGAVLRCADAAGAKAVLITKSRGTPLTPVARKVASGAAENVAVIEISNLARALQRLSAGGYRIVGTGDESAQNLFECVIQGRLVLVLGSEDKGLRRLTRECCDLLVRIPMAGVVSSLNVSVAAGICLFEIRRQQSKSQGAIEHLPN